MLTLYTDKMYTYVDVKKLWGILEFVNSSETTAGLHLVRELVANTEDALRAHVGLTISLLLHNKI